MPIIKVLIPQNGLFPLSYIAYEDQDIEIGQLVVVPFRQKKITGIIWEIENGNNQASDVPYKLKSIEDHGKFAGRVNQNFLNFIAKVSNYYMADLGTIAKLVLPVNVNENPIIAEHQAIPAKFDLKSLSLEQDLILQEIWHQRDKPTILKGVTGSGKTEVYFHLIAKYLAEGQTQILVMLPEIALSQQIIDRFNKQFGFECAIWNASISKAKKKRILRAIIAGEISVIIGARSSLFLPYKNLKLIIIDEEHDHSYKQTDGITYHARDMAVLFSAISNCQVILASATPSIETLNNANQGKYKLLELKNRYQNALLPQVKIIDMSRADLPKNRWISTQLVNVIRAKLELGEQSLLFLNRKGYAPVMLCKACGYKFNCINCSAYMVVHKARKIMQCHHCGAKSQMHNHCPNCTKKDDIVLCGPGIERIAEEASILFPNSKIAVISKDDISKEQDQKLLLQQMENGEIDILIGTQLITKGYHFPNLTLVGVIDADLGLIGGDLRSSEKMYQLLHQVSGRAGRASKAGEVFLQTYNPDNKLFQALIQQKESEYIAQEILSRKEYNMPPFTKMASIIITGNQEARTFEFANKIARLSPKSTCKILGPAESLIFKLSGKYRYRILIIADKKFRLQEYIELWLRIIKIPSYLHVKIDIDPYNFM